MKRAENLYYERCSNCHLGAVEKRIAKEWMRILDSMRFQAGLAETDFKVISRYLKAFPETVISTNRTEKENIK